ncbi:MAG: guanylate kinase [Burkholderiales bacterium]
MSGTLYIVCAPSGAGKTTLTKALLDADPQVRLSVSYTTRAPRAGENEGVHYRFVDLPAFEHMAATGEFLESALVHGNRYGTSKRWIDEARRGGTDILLEIDWQGAAQVRRLIPDAVGIFIVPPSFEALAERLKGRGQDSPDTIARRLTAAREEMSHVPEFDYVIINNEFSRAAQDLIAIVRAHRLRLARQLERHRTLFEGFR